MKGLNTSMSCLAFVMAASFRTCCMIADFGSEGPPKFIVLSMLKFYNTQRSVAVFVKRYLEVVRGIAFLELRRCYPNFYILKRPEEG